MYVCIFLYFNVLGVVAFVDYKLDNDRSGIGIIHLLGKLGAQVEKTFNRKVITNNIQNY